jgi:hypothetical protein
MRKSPATEEVGGGVEMEIKRPSLKGAAEVPVGIGAMICENAITS